MTDLPVAITEFPPYSDTGRCFERSSIGLVDGTQLTVYRTEPGSSLSRVVVASSLGFPAAFLEPLGVLAAGRFQVITWDQRCMPGRGIQDFASIGPGTHADDLRQVFDHFAIDEATLLGYCNGAEVALMASIPLANRLKRVVMTNAHYSMKDERKHTSTHGLWTVLSDIARNPGKAQRYYDMLRLMEAGDQPVPTSISKYPFGFGADKLHRLAIMIENYRRNDIASWVAGVTVPCVSVIAEADDTSDPAQSIEVVNMLSRCESVRAPDADHYSLYSSPAFQAQMLGLVAP